MVSKASSLHKFPNAYFPDTYLVIDIETTGFNPEDNFITQFGLMMVCNRTIVGNPTSLLLQIPEGSMSKGASEVTGITEEMCNTQGMARNEAIHSIRHTLTNWRQSRPNALFVGHNAAKFDLPFIEKEFDKCGIDFRFGTDELIDTGAIVKAQQLGTYPLNGEALMDFMLRVSRIRATGVFWSLDRYCLDRFNLRERLKQEKRASHDAASDCVVTHWVLEALRAEREELIKKHGAHTG